MCKWYEFHKWENIFEPHEYMFMGSVCINNRYSGYKRCKKCGIIDETFYGYTNRVSDCETVIINSKISYVDGNLQFKLITLKEVPPDE